VREFLVREGYDVQESALVTGRSGAEQKIDILATKHNGPLEHRIVVGFANADVEVDADEVIKHFHRAYDVNAHDVILVVSPRLSEEAQKTASHYHVRVYNAEDLDRMEGPLAA